MNSTWGEEYLLFTYMYTVHVRSWCSSLCVSVTRGVQCVLARGYSLVGATFLGWYRGKGLPDKGQSSALQGRGYARGNFPHSPSQSSLHCVAHSPFTPPHKKFPNHRNPLKKNHFVQNLPVHCVREKVNE